MEEKTAVTIWCDHQSETFDISEKGKVPVRMDESYLERYDRNAKKYTDQHKRKLLRRVLKSMKQKPDIRISSNLQNSEAKLRPPNGQKRKPTDDDLADGIKALLGEAGIFENRIAGFRLVADQLIGMRCDEIRQATPDSLTFITAINKAPQEICELLSELISFAVTKSRWKDEGNSVKITVHRETVLDYRDQTPGFPYNVREFAQMKIKLKHCKPITYPALYTNTIAVIIGADGRQTRNALELMKGASVYLLNCTVPDELRATRESAAELDKVSHSAIQNTRDAAPFIGAALRWWQLLPNDGKWASHIVANAQQRFRLPNQGDYESIIPDVKKLRDAVRCEVLKSFLYTAVKHGFLETANAEQLKKQITDTFWPEPTATQEIDKKRIEDPIVFHEIMRSIIAEQHDNIVPQGERFVKRGKMFGAFRMIGDTQYIVIPEEKWSSAYKKAARNSGMDTSFCQLMNDWPLKLLRLLRDNDLVKHTKDPNPRYRYDLYGTGEKDTYVVAVPWEAVKIQ